MGFQSHTSEVVHCLKLCPYQIILYGKKDNQKVFTIFDILKVFFFPNFDSLRGLTITIQLGIDSSHMAQACSIIRVIVAYTKEYALK